MNEHFIVDWQETDEDQAVKPCVSVHMQGRQAGLYRVKEVTRKGVLLSHGAISFPVGTQLDIEDFRAVSLGARHAAQVVANDGQGVQLSW